MFVCFFFILISQEHFDTKLSLRNKSLRLCKENVSQDVSGSFFFFFFNSSSSRGVLGSRFVLHPDPYQDQTRLSNFKLQSAVGTWLFSLLFCQCTSRPLLTPLLHRTFAAHVIVRFALRLLDEELSSPRESDLSRSLCGAFIFVCRQIYNTCEGLQVLRPYGLHRAVAAAWKKVPNAASWSGFLFFRDAHTLWFTFPLRI